MPRFQLSTLAFAALAVRGADAFADSCGPAPSGELKAERVAGVTASHAGPGLFEGPVWIGDALYFSDFSFAKGFPSRVRKGSKGQGGKLESGHGGSPLVHCDGGLVPLSFLLKRLYPCYARVESHAGA